MLYDKDGSSTTLGAIVWSAVILIPAMSLCVIAHLMVT
jgi:hypothetical protein